MILSSCDPKEIGATYRGISLPDGTIQDHPYRVIREATLEEWRAQAESGLVVLAASDNWGKPSADHPARFYEVSTD
jgi:hypothetical protein